MKSIAIKNPEHTLKMQRLTFGAGSFKDYSKKEDYFKLLDCYYNEFGGRSFDTARAYFIWEKGGEGVSERVLGEWIKSRGIKRDEIVVTTKGGFPYLEDYHRHRLDKKSLYTDMEESLDALSLDYIDCYLLHRDTTYTDFFPIVKFLQFPSQSVFCTIRRKLDQNIRTRKQRLQVSSRRPISPHTSSNNVNSFLYFRNSTIPHQIYEI